MEESKTNLIEKELARKVERKLKKQIKAGIQTMLEGCPNFRFDTVNFPLEDIQVDTFSVYDPSFARIRECNVKLSLDSTDSLERLVYEIFNQVFSKTLLDEEIKLLIKKATLLD